MNILKKLLLIPYMWYWMIPIRLGALAFAGYFLLMYLIYGSLSPIEIRLFLKESGTTMFWGFFVPFGVPTLLSLGAMFGVTSPSAAPNLNNINRAIQFRNGQMSVSTPQGAAEILEKTAHLDMIAANSDQPVFNSALQGFDAKYGASSPTTVFNEMMKK